MVKTRGAAITYVVFTMTFALQTVSAGALADETSTARSMVIVAPDRFHGQLKRFHSYRATQRPTELVSLQSILKSTPGVDDPERLKRWLYQAWKERAVRYVLLVGDADLVPVRYMVLDRVTPAAFD